MSRLLDCLFACPSGGDEKLLEALLVSLVSSHEASMYRHHLNLLMYVVNTDKATASYLAGVEDTLDRVNGLAGRCAARMLWDPNSPARTRQNSLYGYDVSDMLLDYLLEQVRRVSLLAPCDWCSYWL